MLRLPPRLKGQAQRGSLHSCQISGDNAREDDAVESPGSADTGHADGALLDFLEMEEISADEWAGNARDIGDRRRRGAWSKNQRQDRRYRRGYQAGQQDADTLHRPGEQMAHRNIDDAGDEHRAERGRALRREFLETYVIKAVPCILVWIKLQYDMLRFRGVQ